MSRGLLIQPDGSHEFREINDHTDIVDAVGPFDWTDPGPVTYYCYEYALYERPRNPCATALYTDTHPHVDGVLAGPVLVMGPPVNDDDTDVPQEYVELFERIRDDWGPEEINRMATPLSNEDQFKIHMQSLAATDQATAALQEGRAVDFGGIRIGVDNPAPGVIVTGPVDGQHRTERR